MEKGVVKMTEKKYMTASEFMESKGYTTNIKGSIFTNFKELDTHFINKYLLKDKIKLILDKHRYRFPTSIENGAIIYSEELEKEILELLK